jgi:hypothetical protein
MIFGCTFLNIVVGGHRLASKEILELMMVEKGTSYQFHIIRGCKTK